MVSWLLSSDLTLPSPKPTDNPFSDSLPTLKSSGVSSAKLPHVLEFDDGTCSRDDVTIWPDEVFRLSDDVTIWPDDVFRRSDDVTGYSDDVSWWLDDVTLCLGFVM